MTGDGYCETCQFWQRYDHPDIPPGYGLCREGPPIPVRKDGRIVYDMPTTGPGNWCGRHHLRRRKAYG